MPNLRVPKCPSQVSGRKTVLRPQASRSWEARRDSGGARSRSVQVLRPSPPLAKAQSGPFPALLHPHPSFTEGCKGVKAEPGRTGQPPKAPTASKPFPTQQPNPSELTFQRFLKGFFPNHTILSSFPCVFPSSYLCSHTGIPAVRGRHKTHPASGPLHWITTFASFTQHSDGFSFYFWLL